ncbi:hypothetical protein RDI58_006526 [Solanum bulbocastanum]|uniref:Phytocyanin domain-containing protein n=1 Tax=Solanum bulbocastanum TaxID=147425 RepID=A0AAN8YRZ1_SOLBU
MALTCFGNVLISILVMMSIASSLQLVSASSSMEFQVGDTTGWTVPPQNDTIFYNNWASAMRFKIGDTIRFKYKKDSVMEVTDKDYKKCNSTLPHFFSNSGNTMFTLEHSGYYYFISGAAGHCERGQRMILRVMVIPTSHAPFSFPIFQQLLHLLFFLFLSLCLLALV